MNQGTSPLRTLGRGNPFVLPSKTISSGQARFFATSGGFTPGSTTDTTNWVSVNQFSYRVPSAKTLVLISLSIHVKHSVANATYGFRVTSNTAVDGSGSGDEYAIGGVDNLILPATANNWQLCSFPTALQFVSPLWVPGTHRFLYQIRNYTAGTLTFVQNAGFATDVGCAVAFGSFLL